MLVNLSTVKPVLSKRPRDAVNSLKTGACLIEVHLKLSRHSHYVNKKCNATHACQQYFKYQKMYMKIVKKQITLMTYALK